MSDIAPIGGSNPADLNRTGQTKRPTVPAGTPPRREDQVELSRTAQLLSKIAELPDIRQDLVDRVKGEIETGNYETSEKIEGALDELMEDLN